MAKLQNIPRANRANEFAYPGGIWHWVVAFAIMPFFFLIGLSVYDGWPPRDDIVAWAFLIFLTFLCPVGVAVNILMWHLRERSARPVWWTEARQMQLGKAVWLSGVVAFLMMSGSDKGSGTTVHWFGLWMLIIAPTYLYLVFFDAGLVALGRFWNQRRAR